jgi:hypothetical protein
LLLDTWKPVSTAAIPLVTIANGDESMRRPFLHAHYNDLDRRRAAEQLRGHFPFGCLAISGVALNELEATLNAYELDSFTASEGLALVRTRSRREGAHKAQSVRLFFSAVELARGSESAELAVFRVEPLYHELVRATRGGPSLDESAIAKARQQLGGGGVIRLDEATSFDVRQAGLSFAVEGPVVVARSELPNVHSMLVALAGSRVVALAG